MVPCLGIQGNLPQRRLYYSSGFFFLLKMKQADHGACPPPNIPSILKDPEMLLTGVIFALLKYSPA